MVADRKRFRTLARRSTMRPHEAFGVRGGGLRQKAPQINEPPGSFCVPARPRSSAAKSSDDISSPDEKVIDNDGENRRDLVELLARTLRGPLFSNRISRVISVRSDRNDASFSTDKNIPAEVGMTCLMFRLGPTDDGRVAGVGGLALEAKADEDGDAERRTMKATPSQPPLSALANWTEIQSQRAGMKPRRTRIL